MNKLVYIITGIAVLVLIFSAGCVQTQGDVRTAADGDNVTVAYTLTLDDGSVYQTTVGKTPLTFVIGSGKTVTGFNNAVIGMAVGETKTVHLTPDEGYGKRSHDLLSTMNLSDTELTTNKTAAVGDEYLVIVQASSGYVQMEAEILEIHRANNSMTAALNYPLAGKNLTFEITLESINT